MRDEEEQTSMKRLRKQDEKRSWSAKEVALARGYTEEQSEALLGVLPDRTLIYGMEEEPNT